MADIDTLLNTFDAIKDFATALKDSFQESKNSPLSLYVRLIGKTDVLERVVIMKFIDSYKTFFESFGEFILNEDINELHKIPRDTKIRYAQSEKIYVDIQKFISKSDADEKKSIRSHLLNIYSLVKPSPEAEKALKESLTFEGQEPGDVFKNIFQTVLGEFNKSGIADKLTENDTQNPEEIMNTVLNSGIMQKMLSGFVKPGNSSSPALNADLIKSMMGSFGNIN